MAAINGKYIRNKYIAARTQDAREFLMAILMFSGSGNKTRLLQKPFNVYSCEESQMALSNFRLTNDIVNSQLIHWSGGVISTSG